MTSFTVSMIPGQVEAEMVAWPPVLFIGTDNEDLNGWSKLLAKPSEASSSEK